MHKCLAILYLTACSSLWGQNAPKHQKAAASAATNQATQAGNPVPPAIAVVNPVPSAPPSKPATPGEQQQSPSEPLKWFLRPEWVMVWVTIIYTILTGFTLRAIKRQANLMAEQLADARKDSAESAKATADTLSAIQRQGLSMRRQTSHLRKYAESSKISSEAALLNALAVVASERPFIKVDIKADIDGDYFRIMATNCGKSPAEIMIHSSEWGFFSNDDGPSLPPIYNADGYVDTYRRILAPGDPPFMVGQPLMVAEMRTGGHALMSSADRGEHFLFYWGKVSYVSPLTKKREDIPPYETRWCFQYVPAIHLRHPTLIRAGGFGYNEHT